MKRFSSFQCNEKILFFGKRFTYPAPYHALKKFRSSENNSFIGSYANGDFSVFEKLPTYPNFSLKRVPLKRFRLQVQASVAHTLVIRIAHNMQL